MSALCDALRCRRRFERVLATREQTRVRLCRQHYRMIGRRPIALGKGFIRGAELVRAD